ncbi:sugar phosphate isomerase/epimerase [Castellaniella ginsengisoli]|uniref:Sugar phosphate isomerase/epimerase n=1 Tax=Castellaniella ginsengisoli TaxID=546114 RepID=A0AB39GU57_9BURK
MQRRYSLAHLTLLSLDPPAMIQAAAQAGYDACGLRLLPFTPGGIAYDLMGNPDRLRETLALMHDTGVRVEDIEIIRLGASFEVDACLPFLETGARLGARNVLVSGEDADAARLADSFARLCEACRPHGLSADLEFMPWLATNSLTAARRVVEAADQPNGGVLIDPLHFSRSASTLDDLADLPRPMIHYAQICDAPAAIPASLDELIQTSRSARLAPGEGEINLQGIFARLPQDIPISVEIPNDAQCARLGAQAWIRHCLEAARRFFSAPPGQHPAPQQRP